MGQCTWGSGKLYNRYVWEKLGATGSWNMTCHHTHFLMNVPPLRVITTPASLSPEYGTHCRRCSTNFRLPVRFLWREIGKWANRAESTSLERRARVQMCEERPTWTQCTDSRSRHSIYKHTGNSPLTQGKTLNSPTAHYLLHITSKPNAWGTAVEIFDNNNLSLEIWFEFVVTSWSYPNDLWQVWYW